MLHRLGSVLLERGEVGEAGDLADASYGLVVKAGSRKQIAQARLLLGAVDLARSEQAAAENVFGEVLGTARRHRDPRLEAHALWGLAWSHAASARIESGAKLLEEAVRLAHADDDRYLLAHLLHDRRTLLAGEQRDEGVAGRHEAAIVLFKGLIAEAGSGVAAATQPGEVSVPQARRSSGVRDEVGDGDRCETVDYSRDLLGALRDQCV
ncbi:hypothetical protein [Pseudonocardia sp. HH130629-09]|uniref:hypothetical protein n=1 Tax=Pseudonocardia sp. HH130629-09 TaxID=1641402 RepID=UPI0006CB1A63|nr:hypothetical protein [Pseudonocardia sp. HH130629-09]ALE82798.1 hypothetical protein XF36_06180 [Pseudonocardia sp. HH130629-09]